MFNFTRTLLAAGLTASCALLPAVSHAEGVETVTCSVAVDYTRNNVLDFAYRRDFVVDSTAPYFDDFSNRIRIREFRATVERVAAGTMVSIDYFNDVGVFTSVGFNTSLVVNGGNVATTSGSSSTYITSSASPGVVGGTHTTSYTLSCRRV